MLRVSEHDTGRDVLSAMVNAVSSCSDTQDCYLRKTCKRIHEAFLLSTPKSNDKSE